MNKNLSVVHYNSRLEGFKDQNAGKLFAVFFPVCALSLGESFMESINTFCTGKM